MPHRLFPSILPDSDADFVDDSYSTSELQQKDYNELRAIAAEHPSDAVHGRMGQEDLIENLEGKKRVSIDP